MTSQSTDGETNGPSEKPPYDREEAPAENDSISEGPETTDVPGGASVPSLQQLQELLSEELDKVIPHLVQALKVNKAHDELVGRLNEAEKRLQAREMVPLIGRVRHILLAVRKNEYSPELRDWIVEELETTLTGSGFLEFGEVGEKFDPERHEAVAGQGEGGTGAVVSGIIAPGLESLGEVVAKARVEVSPGKPEGQARVMEEPSTEEGSEGEQGSRD